MKKLLMIMMMALALASCSSTKDSAKTQLQRQVDSIAHLKALQAVEQGYFVIQATTVTNSYGGILTGVDRNANFLLLQNDRSMFQIAALRADPGLNGLGGITLEGEVRQVDISRHDNPQDDVTVRYMMVGSRVNASVFITLHKNSDMASVMVTPTLGAGNISFRGRLIPYRNSGISINP